MNTEKYYQVLGLRPDASGQEVKNAYRDLAKVWHPDRFAHDPRLQQKAQEKLKEINEAYEEINSPAAKRRRAHRPTTPPPSWSSPNSSTRPPRGPADFATVVARRRDAPPSLLRLLPAAFAIAALVAIYFVSYRYLDPNMPAPAGAGPRAATQAAGETRAEEVSNAGERRAPKAAGKQPRAGEGAGAAGVGEGTAPSGARQSAPATYKALPTVNLTIDPTTGLLATRACPLKALRTFASGQEPQKFCDADHSRKSASVSSPAPATAPAAAQAAAQSPAPPAAKQKSRLKSVLGTVASPGKWFRRTEAPRGETKSGAGQQ